MSDLFVRDGAAAWSQSRCVRGCGLAAFETISASRFLTRSPGARARVLARARLTHIAGGSNSVAEDVSYAVSDTHAAKVERSQGTSGDEFFQRAHVFAGPVTAPPLKLFTCRAYDLAVALDADWLAYSARRCPGGGARITVRDLEGEEARDVQTGGFTPTELALEGDFLAAAGQEGPGVRIAAWNWRTGQSLASIDLPSRPRVPVPAIANDGSLAFVARRGVCGGTLSVVRPGESAATEVASGICGEPHWVGDALAVERRDRLAAVTPGGSERTLLSLGSVRLEGLAADADDLAYILPTCSGRHAVYLVRTNAPAAEAGPAGCPLFLPPQELTADSRRRVRVRVSCARGCFGVVRIRAGGKRVANEFYDRRGPRSSVTVKLRRGFMRQLQEGGAMRVTLSADTLDRAGRTVKQSRVLRLAAG